MSTKKDSNKPDEEKTDETETKEDTSIFSIPPEIEEILEDWDIMHDKSIPKQQNLSRTDNLLEVSESGDAPTDDSQPSIGESDRSDTQSYHSAQSTEAEEITETATISSPIHVPVGPRYFARVHELTTEFLKKTAEYYQIELSGSRQDNINQIETKLRSNEQIKRSEDGKPLITANIFIEKGIPISQYRHFQLKQVATQLGLSKTNSEHIKTEIKNESKKKLLKAILKHFSSLKTTSQTDPIIVNLPSGEISPEHANRARDLSS